MTWGECDKNPLCSGEGIESLINRGVMRETTTAWGAKEGFALDVEFFDYAQKAVVKEM